MIGIVRHTGEHPAAAADMALVNNDNAAAKNDASTNMVTNPSMGL